MHDLPQNLLEPIREFEEQFTVDRTKLKEVVDHFVKELEKGASRLLAAIRPSPTLPLHRANINPALTGLSVQGGNIVSSIPALWAN